MKMLESPTGDGIVAWNEDGNSFVILDPTKLATKLLPRFFQQAQYTSFVRRLFRWGFKSTKCKTLGKSTYDSYHHDLFQKDRRDLCSKIRCPQKNNIISESKKSLQDQRYYKDVYNRSSMLHTRIYPESRGQIFCSTMHQPCQRFASSFSHKSMISLQNRHHAHNYHDTRTCPNQKKSIDMNPTNAFRWIDPSIRTYFLLVVPNIFSPPVWTSGTQYERNPTVCIVSVQRIIILSKIIVTFALLALISLLLQEVPLVYILLSMVD